MAKFVKKCPCLRPPTEEVRTLDYRHSNLKDVPAEIFNFERTLEELFVDSNEIRDLPKELFYCHGLRKLTLSDNEITAIPPVISSLVNLEEIDISKNGIIDMPENIKCCKYLRILESSVNPLGKIPEGFTQLLNLTELYLNDTFLDYLPGNFGRLSKLKILEIRENNLKTLPKSLSRLVSLERLDIGQNQFTELEDVIGHMANLLELWCDSNKIGAVTKGLGNLKQLMFMDACKNRIQVLPDEIEGCSSLADLHLTTNRLQSLPETLGALENLTTLKVDDNSLFSLPSTMGGLASLSELNVSANDLEELPPSIGFLRNLRTFYADENLLMSLPPELGSCSGITVLSIRSNRLTYLPDEIGRIPGLRVVNVSDNKLVNLPFSVVKLKNLQAMWLSENQTKPLIPLQSELDPQTDRKVLTCYLLPQGAMEQNTYDNNEDAQSFHPSMWEEERVQRQQIHFAGFTDDDFDDEGHLVRCPTPFPKEMREKARHARNLALRQVMGSSNGEVHPTHCHDNMAYESEGHNSQRSRSPNRVSVGAVRGRASPDARVREARITKPSSPSLHNTHRLFLCDKEKTQKDKARMRINSPEKNDMGKSPKGGKSARPKSGDFSVGGGKCDETDTGGDNSNRDRDKSAATELSQQNNTFRQTPTNRKSETSHQGSLQRLGDNPQVMRLRPGSANVSDSRYKYSDRVAGHMTSHNGRKLPTPNMILSPEFQYNGNHSLPLNSSRHSRTGRSRRGREYDSDTGYRSDTRSDIGYRSDTGHRSDTGCRSDTGYKSDQDVFRTRRQAMLLMYGPRGAGGSHGHKKGDNSMWETSSERPRKPRHRDGYASDLEAYSGRLFNSDVSRTNTLQQQQQLRNTARSVPHDLHQESQGHGHERPKSEHFLDSTYRPYPSKISLRGDELYSNKTLPSDQNQNETDLKSIPSASSPASFYQGNFVDQSTPVATDPSQSFTNQTESKPSTPRSQNSDSDSKGGNWRRELYTVLEQKMQSTLNLQENNSHTVNNPKSLREGGGAVGRGRTPPPYHPAPPYYPATNSHSSSRQLPRTPQEKIPHYLKTDEQWTHTSLVNHTPNQSHHPQNQSHFALNQSHHTPNQVHHVQNISHHTQNPSHHSQNQSQHAPYDLSEDGGGYSPGLYPDNIDSTNPPLSRYDDVALFKSPEPISHVSSSTDSGYDHGQPIYERLEHYGRNNSGCGSSTPSSTPRLHSSSPMAPGSSQENSSVPHSREITPIKDMEDSQGRELFQSLQYSSKQTLPSNIFEISISKNPGLGFSIAGGLGSCGNPFRKQDQGIFVTKVHRESPAAQSIQPGDKLVQVNGVNFNNIDHEQAVAILKNCSTVNLLVERR